MCNFEFEIERDTARQTICFLLQGSRGDHHIVSTIKPSTRGHVGMEKKFRNFVIDKSASYSICLDIIAILQTFIKQRVCL